MQSGIFFQSLKTGLFFLFILFLGWCPVHAAEFTADLTVTSPESEIVYDLKVKDNMYRIKKVKGLEYIPSLPTIYNRSAGMSWGLNPQVNQYVEQADPAKTMMMNPVAGWEFMRRKLEATPAGTEAIQGYSCQIIEYRQQGDTRVANRVWVCSELDFILKEISYALNGNTTLALKNIKKGSVDPALVKIPPGYTKVVIEKAAKGNSTKYTTKKLVMAKKSLSKTLNVKRMSAHGIGLEPDRHIIITATENSAGESISLADMKVLDKGNNEIIAEKITLQKGETRTWEILPDKNPWKLMLSGEKGLIKFKIDQLTLEPAGTEQAPAPPQVSKKDKPKTASSPEESLAPANLMFILDASGSMWGQVEGKPKIAIAKEVLSDLIRGLPEKAVVGLVAYGHRRKGDCNDVEELIALGPLNKKAMIAQIQQLNARGKTPISRSVRLTAEGIKHLEDETTIILVSDGKETCDPDPCGLVKNLKASGIKFIMHVIGFDVTQEEKLELECMAREGGGKYFTADNAGEFSAAAREVVKKPIPAYGTLRILVTKNKKPFSTAVKITNLETGKTSAPVSSSDKTGIAELRLDPGNYLVELKDLTVSGGKAPSVKLTDIVINAGETIERNADFSDGSLVVTTLLNGRPFKGHIFYYRQGEKKHFHNENTHPKTGQLKRKLLPGLYRIKAGTDSITGKPAVIFDSLKIAPGSTVEKTAEFFSGEVTIASTLDGKPYAMPFKIYDLSGKKIFKNWTQNGQRLVRLAAGIYTIKVTTNVDGSIKSFENVIIETGQSQTVTADFNFGKITIAATLNGKAFSTPFKIYDHTGKQVRKNWTQNGQRTEMLAEGVYTVKVTSIKDNKQVVTFENVNIINSQIQTVTADFPVTAKAAEQPAPLKAPLPTAAGPLPTKGNTSVASPVTAEPIPAPSATQENQSPAPSPLPQAQIENSLLGENFPVYPGAKIVNQKEAGKMILTKLEAVTIVSEVTAFYQKELPQKGWNQAMEIPQGDKVSIMFTQGKDNLVLEAKQRQEKVTFSLNLMKK